MPALFSNPALEFFIVSHIAICIKVQTVINDISIVIAKIEFNVHWKSWSTMKLLRLELLPEHCNLELGNNPFQSLFTFFVYMILMVNFGPQLWSRCSVEQLVNIREEIFLTCCSSFPPVCWRCNKVLEMHLPRVRYLLCWCPPRSPDTQRKPYIGSWIHASPEIFPHLYFPACILHSVLSSIHPSLIFL